MNLNEPLTIPMYEKAGYNKPVFKSISKRVGSVHNQNTEEFFQEVFGAALTIQGTVYKWDNTPFNDASIELWQSNQEEKSDNYRFKGMMKTDDSGNFIFRIYLSEKFSKAGNYTNPILPKLYFLVNGVNHKMLYKKLSFDQYGVFQNLSQNDEEGLSMHKIGDEFYVKIDLRLSK